MSYVFDSGLATGREIRLYWANILFSKNPSGVMQNQIRIFTIRITNRSDLH